MNKNELKVLLVNPPQTFYPGSQPFCKSFPVGLGYIAVVLDTAGYFVEVLDLLITGFEISSRGDVRQYGMSFDNIEKEIKNRAPNIVGIGCPFTAQHDNMLKVAEIVKRINPKALVVVGGPHVSVRAKEILAASNDVDIAVLGEGEFTMLRIVEAYCAGEHEKINQINGIVYRENNKIISNNIVDFIQHLDDLPFPAYYLFDMEKYCNMQDQYLYSYTGEKYFKELSIITSRGCPFNCVFCSIHLHMGKKWRANSASHVIYHLKYVARNYGINFIHFDDDNLTLNKERFSDILDGIINENIAIAWDTPNGVRADMSLELVKKAKQSGCHSLTMAVESGDQAVLDTIINKKLDLKNVLNMAKACKELKLPLSAFFVLGFPGETIKNMENTVNFAKMLNKQYDVEPAFMIATPLYGTRLYDICKEKGYIEKDISPRALSEGTQISGTPLVTTDTFRPEDIIRIISSVKLNRNLISIVKRILNKIRRVIANLYK